MIEKNRLVKQKVKDFDNKQLEALHAKLKKKQE